MSNVYKKYKSLVFLDKLAVWSFLFTVVGMPSVVIAYFQYFGNDDIANKLYRALQVNSRAHIHVQSANISNYRNEGKVLVLNIKNLSNFQVRNIKTKVLVSKNTELVEKFQNSILTREDLGIPPKTTSQIAVLTLKQLGDYIHKEYPQYQIVDIVLLNQQYTHSGLGYPFYIFISYKTDGDEDMNKSVALNAILSLKS